MWICEEEEEGKVWICEEEEGEVWICEEERARCGVAVLLIEAGSVSRPLNESEPSRPGRGVLAPLFHITAQLIHKIANKPYYGPPN